MFLDEVDALSPALQGALLQTIENHRVRRGGAVQDRTVDVRLVAATRRDLKAARAGFRRDLYYRLSSVVLALPPLRDRRREIPLLAKRFGAEAADREGRKPLAIGTEALDVLQRYDWPGNVSELREVMSTAALQCPGEEIDLQDLPVEILEATGSLAVGDASQQVPDAEEGPRLPLDPELRSVEKRRIEEALGLSGGNQSEAARILGMPRHVFTALVDALDIDLPRPNTKSG